MHELQALCSASEEPQAPRFLQLTAPPAPGAPQPKSTAGSRAWTRCSARRGVRRWWAGANGGGGAGWHEPHSQLPLEAWLGKQGLRWPTAVLPLRRWDWHLVHFLLALIPSGGESAPAGPGALVAEREREPVLQPQVRAPGTRILIATSCPPKTGSRPLSPCSGGPAGQLGTAGHGQEAAGEEQAGVRVCMCMRARPRVRVMRGAALTERGPGPCTRCLSMRVQ